MNSNETNKGNNIDYYDYQEYYFNNDNKIYKIIVEKRENLIIIKNSNYMINMNIQELAILFKENFNNINQAYEYINNIFEFNEVKIENIKIKKEMKLILHNKGSEIEIILLYYTKHSNYFIDEIFKLKNDINDLKKENIELKKSINNSINTEEDEENKCCYPKDITLLEDLTNDSFTSINIDNTFTVFKSIDDILYLIYSNIKKSIICYDLNQKEICQEIKNAHKSYITNFTHYLDDINNRDLILSISQIDNNIKIWQAKNWECLLNIPHVNTEGILYSSSFINDNNNIYILTSNCNWDDNNEYIKIYDLKGNKIRNINDSNEITFYTNVYYDEMNDKKYIITGNLNCIKVYDYNKNELYKKYYDKDNDNNCHFVAIINKIEESVNIIESCDDGNIRIWDFFSGELIKKIKVNEGTLYGMCLWNQNYLFVGCSNKNMRLIDLDEGKIKDLELEGHNNEILTIKKIELYQYGPCLISQGLGNDQIKLWTKKN